MNAYFPDEVGGAGSIPARVTKPLTRKKVPRNNKRWIMQLVAG